MATIKLRQNGPYLVEGDDVTVLDWNGKPYEIARRPVALCRCGGSTKKPFCDGTHSKIGFQAAEAAVAGSEDKPAARAPIGFPSVSAKGAPEHADRLSFGVHCLHRFHGSPFTSAMSCMSSSPSITSFSSNRRVTTSRSWRRSR